MHIMQLVELASSTGHSYVFNITIIIIATNKVAHLWPQQMVDPFMISLYGCYKGNGDHHAIGIPMEMGPCGCIPCG